MTPDEPDQSDAGGGPDQSEPPEDGSTVTRRRVLAALLGIGAAGAAYGYLTGGERPASAGLDDERARELAETYAPTLYFDAAERWFPTDPRPYTSERGEETVVDGFDALDGYADDGGSENPPQPTVFYNAVAYEASSLAVVQFWMYSVFDQFATNFHWHDWEVLHAFVDLESGAPQLFVASSHSRRVPNNEFLDPERRPRVLSELGSHSSALSMNAMPDRFRRLPGGEILADITNSGIDGLPELGDVPAAYGLPRDEGAILPFVVPELDGDPLHDHPRLPAVSADDFIPDALTVRSLDALASPPDDLPARATGRTFEAASRPGTADHDYELVQTEELEHIDAFVGPQLSFEFAVPGVVEDAIAGHITTAGVPWDQPRYADPVADVTDPTHRGALARRYDVVGSGSPVDSVVAQVQQAVPEADAPDGKGLTTETSPVEALALLESEAVAVPTFRGIAVVRDVAPGEHRLTVNAAGLAPHSEPVTVGAGDGATAAGVAGEVPLVARGEATKLTVGTEEGAADIASVAVADDFAGRLYEAAFDGADAVYVHRDGAFTTEVRDVDEELGAYRIVPGETPTDIPAPRTGKTVLSTFVGDIAGETAAEVAEVAEAREGTTRTPTPTATETDTATATEQFTERTATPTETATATEVIDETATPTETEIIDQTATATETVTDTTDVNRASEPADPVVALARALAAVAAGAQAAAEAADAGERGGADERLAVVAERIELAAERLALAREDLPAPLSRATERRLEQASERTAQAREAATL